MTEPYNQAKKKYMRDRFIFLIILIIAGFFFYYINFVDTVFDERMWYVRPTETAYIYKPLFENLIIILIIICIIIWAYEKLRKC